MIFNNNLYWITYNDIKLNLKSIIINTNDNINEEDINKLIKYITKEIKEISNKNIENSNINIYNED